MSTTAQAARKKFMESMQRVGMTVDVRDRVRWKQMIR